MSNIFKKAIVVLFILFFVAPELSAEDVKDAERPEEKSHIGTVTHIKHAGVYTYIKLDEQGKEVWLATFPIKVSVGDKVEYIGGILMKDFHSKAMDMTFDFILLITQIRNLNDNPLEDKQPEYHESLSENKSTLSIPKSGEIEKAEGDKTIEEIFSEREQLKDKEVTVRAKVMKVSKNILGKSWVALQDGTGVSPDNRLIATTLESVNIGDIITAKGIIRTDVDIGTNYKYKVLIEDTKFTK